MIELLALVLIVILFVNNRTAFKRIETLEKRVADLSARAAKPSLSATAAAVLPASSAEAGEATDEPAEITQETSTPATAGEPPSVAAMEAAPADAQTEGLETQVASSIDSPKRARRRESIEDYLGARWAVWAGGLALALGQVGLLLGGV